MSNYTKENSYLIAEGEEGELYVFIEAKKSRPMTPKIVYDGNEHAIFVRNSEQNIILDYIHPDIREKLRHAKMVVVVETILENIKDSYMVELNRVEKIPLDWNKIGLGKSWEEIALSKKK